MGFLSRFFIFNKVECPRCLGKGIVSMEDIKRLKKELFWAIGNCAYCKGNGIVPKKRISKIDPDLSYLTNDISKAERSDLLNGNKAALERAHDYTENAEIMFELIDFLHYTKNKDENQILDYLVQTEKIVLSTIEERKEMEDYIEKVLNRNLPKI